MKHIYNITLILLCFLFTPVLAQQQEAYYENISINPFLGQTEPIALGIMKFNGEGSLESRFYDLLKTQPGIHNRFLIFPYDKLEEQQATLGLRNLNAGDRRTLGVLNNTLDIRYVVTADAAPDGSFTLRLIRTSDGSEVFKGKYALSINSTPLKDAVMLFSSKKATLYKEAALSPKMVRVEGGWFDMGSNDGDTDEKPVHRIHVDNFAIAENEVTFDQFDRFCEMTGRHKPDDNGWGRGKRPVINVSWLDAEEFCRWLSSMTGEKFRLPTEAEWEFAAKGGNKNGGFLYSGSDNIDEVAWNSNNSGGTTHETALKKPNELGLFDMNGNVWEWCQDYYSNNYYAKSSENNPEGPQSGIYHSLRGGSWYSFEGQICRNSTRAREASDYKDNTSGFRVAKIITSGE